MTNDSHLAQRASPGQTPASAAALRMRRCRERRRDGLRCMTIELRETEIDALIHRGLLKAETRNDRRATKAALYEFLDLTLGSAR